MKKYVVATTAEIEPGQRKIVTVRGREIGVFNVHGEFHALINRCPHEGGALCKGQIVGVPVSDTPGSYQLCRQGTMVRCPWHGWMFDIATGKSWCDPESMFARTFGVDVKPGGELVEGPYQAESVNVTVDKSYVVIEM